MLYYLLYHVLQKYFSPLNVFRYITVRTVYASLTAMFLALVFGPWLIRKLRELQIGQYIREEGPQEHKKKAGTPTMGGVLIVLSTAVPVLMWADLANAFVLLALFALLAFAAIGFVDDYAKVAKRRNPGDSQLVERRFVAIGICAVPGLRGHRDYRQFERSEFDGWVGRVGDWMHGDCRGGAHDIDLCKQQFSLGELPGDSVHPTSRRVDRLLRRAGGGLAGIPLVQRAPGGSVYG